jgi:hypothetical protein
MKSLDVWLQELYFEDNDRFRRRTSRLASVITKTLLTIPHAFMFLFCNFGSAMPRKEASAQPMPNDPYLTELNFDEWRGKGLPYSNGTVTRVHLGTSLARVSDLRFALAEIQRVCIPAAEVSIRYTDSADPFQARAIGRRSIDYMLPHGFTIATETEDGVVLRARGTEELTPHPRRIDIGCGPIPREGYAGVDIVPLPGVAIVRDVERHGLPFSDHTITHVHTAHFLEHVNDLVFVMNEIHRVCCANAIITISVPTLLGPFAAADPTHVHHFNARTFRYFEAESGNEPYAGIVKGFEILEQNVGFSLEVTLRVVKDADTPSAQRA